MMNQPATWTALDSLISTVYQSNDEPLLDLVEDVVAYVLARGASADGVREAYRAVADFVPTT